MIPFDYKSVRPLEIGRRSSFWFHCRVRVHENNRMNCQRDLHFWGSYGGNQWGSTCCSTLYDDDDATEMADRSNVPNVRLLVSFRKTDRSSFFTSTVCYGIIALISFFSRTVGGSVCQTSDEWLDTVSTITKCAKNKSLGTGCTKAVKMIHWSSETYTYTFRHERASQCMRSVLRLQWWPRSQW